MEERHEVCASLDELAIETISLIEQNIACQIRLENAMKIANIDMAKSRYIMGQQTVSRLQLPTENTPEFEALCTVDGVEAEAKDEPDSYSLNSRFGEPKSANFVDPLKWFGVLVPQNLHRAQRAYRNAVEYSVEAVNLQKQLEFACDAIEKLKIKKEKLRPEE